MKNFLAIYTGTQENRAKWDKLSDAERNKRQAAGMEAWKDWGKKNAAAIVEQGGPLGKTKRVSKEGVTDIRNAMAAYTIVRAESQSAAAKLTKSSAPPETTRVWSASVIASTSSTSIPIEFWPDPSMSIASMPEILSRTWESSTSWPAPAISSVSSPSPPSIARKRRSLAWMTSSPPPPDR